MLAVLRLPPNGVQTRLSQALGLVVTRQPPSEMFAVQDRLAHHRALKQVPSSSFGWEA